MQEKKIGVVNNDKRMMTALEDWAKEKQADIQINITTVWNPVRQILIRRISMRLSVQITWHLLIQEFHR